MERAGRAGRGETQRPERLDRFLGDALIGAMVLLGLVFCVGAARAQGSTAVGALTEAHFTHSRSVVKYTFDKHISSQRIVTIYS